jgi:hypothetical protein
VEQQAFAAARKAYLTRRRIEWRRPDLSRRAYDRLCFAQDKAEAAYDSVADRVARAWDAYSRLLAPFPIVTEADAAAYELSDVGAEAAVDNLISCGIVKDPHGWHGRGWIDPRKFVTWFLRHAQPAVIVGHNE